MYDKIDVNGADAHPLYTWLKAQQQVSAPGEVRSRPNGDIEWNYAKVGFACFVACGWCRRAGGKVGSLAVHMDAYCQ